MAEQSTELKAPYVAFGTFNNFIAGLAENPDMVPGRIDKTLMKGMSGGAQSQLMLALRFFGLVTGDDDSTAPALLDLIEMDEQGRKEWMAQALAAHYPEALELSNRPGTAGELHDLFESRYGHKGSTKIKAIRFFLLMAEHAGVELSPHFAVPKSPSSTRKRRSNGGSRQDTPQTPPPSKPTEGQTVKVDFGAAGSVTLTVNVLWLDLEDETFMRLRKLIKELEALPGGHREDQGEDDDEQPEPEDEP